MYDNNYSTLISEVRITNDLLEEQIEDLNTLQINLITYLLVLSVILSSAVIYHILSLSKGK